MSEGNVSAAVEPVPDARRALRIAVYGATNVGKSSLVNALVGSEVMTISARGGETAAVHTVELTIDAIAPIGVAPPAGQPLGMPAGEDRLASGTQQDAPFVIDLIDTPGIGDSSLRVPANLALSAVEHSDLVLLVVDGDLTAIEYSALEAARARAKPVIVVLNKIDLMTPRQRRETESALHYRLDAVVGAQNIVGVAAAPYPRLVQGTAAAGHDAERTKLPDIEPLRRRIADIARHEGSALRQLSSLIERGAEAAARQRRRRRARTFVEASAVATSLAVALNPSPLLDVLGGTAALTAIVTGVGKAYGTAIGPAEAQGVARELWRAGRLQLGGIVAAGIGGSLLKALPGVGTAGGALIQAGALGYLCYVFGEAAVAYVENGKRWTDGAAEKTLRNIVASHDPDSITRRIVDQVRARLPFS